MKIFLSTLLISLAMRGAVSLTLDAGADQKEVQARSLMSREELAEKIKGMLPGESSGSASVEVEGNASIIYLDGSKTAFIKVSTEDEEKQVTVEFQNSLEKALLQLNNIDLSNDSSDDFINVRDKYVLEFAQSSSRIINSDDELEQSVYEISNELQFDGLQYNNELKTFTEKDQGGIDNAGDDAASPADSSKRTDILVLRFEIKKDSKFEVILHSNYFSSSIFVNIRTKEYMHTELQKLIADAYKHAKRMVRFNTSNKDSISHTLECSNVLAALKEVDTEFKVLQEEGKVAEDPNTTTYTTVGGHSLQVKCIDSSDFIGVEAQYQRKAADGAEAPLPKVFVQGFMKSSLYDLVPVVQSFFDDMLLHAIRAFGLPEPAPSKAARSVKRAKRVRA